MKTEYDALAQAIFLAALMLSMAIVLGKCGEGYLTKQMSCAVEQQP